MFSEHINLQVPNKCPLTMKHLQHILNLQIHCCSCGRSTVLERVFMFSGHINLQVLNKCPLNMKYLSLCHTLFFITSVNLMPFSFHQPLSIQLTKDELFVFVFLSCTQLEKEDFLENLQVLSCFIQLKNVLLISCVFWISNTS